MIMDDKENNISLTPVIEGPKADLSIIKVLEQRKSLYKDLDAYDKIIEDRITYIWKTICQTLGARYYSWKFDYDKYSDKPPLDQSICKETIHFYLSIDFYKKGEYNDGILLNGKKYYFEGGQFPKRWLTEPFEDELIKGRADYIDKFVKKEKEAAELQKVKDEERKVFRCNILKSICSKLTKEEKEFLKKNVI